MKKLRLCYPNLTIDSFSSNITTSRRQRKTAHLTLNNAHDERHAVDLSRYQR